MTSQRFAPSASTLLLASISLATAACTSREPAKKESPPSATTQPASIAAKDSKSEADSGAKTLYRATITLDGGEIPFYLELGENGKGWMIPSAERFDITYIVKKPKRGARELVITLDEIAERRFIATENASGRLEGTWTARGPLVEGKEFPFAADPVDAINWSSIYKLPGAPIDILGPWHFTLEHLGDGEANFERLGEGGFWTKIRTEGNDFRFVTANATDKEVAIGGFDGYFAFLLRGTWSKEHDSMRGTAHYWNAASGTFEAKRREHAASPDAIAHAALTRPKNRKIRAGLFDSIPGTPTVIEIGGSWCEACEDTRPLLEKIAEENTKDELSLIQLLVEFTDAAEAKKRGATYKASHSIPWQTIAVADLESYKKEFPDLLEPKAFPTFFFVDRKGSIRGVYSGYMPAIKEAEHRAQTELFESMITAIKK